MAGGGMGAMPTDMAQQGGAPMGNPMGSGPGMAGGLGMGGMGFGGGQPGQGGYEGTPMSNPGMPQGDTFQPQMGGQPINMQQISQLLRGLQQAPQQPMQTGSAERNWVSNSPYAQQQPQTPMAPQQPAQQPSRGFFGLPRQMANGMSSTMSQIARPMSQIGQQVAQAAPAQQGIAALPKRQSSAMQGYMDMMSKRRR